MKISDKIYNASPILFQNAAISMYGFYIKQLRYGKSYDQHYALLNKTQYYNKVELDKLQDSLFSDLVGYINQYVPYYKNIINSKNISPKDITLKNFSEIFPVITKTELRNNYDSFLSLDKSQGKHYVINTSGTSGSPLKVHTFKNGIQYNYAFFNRFLNWAGVNIGQKCAVFAGRVFIPPKQTKPPYWRHNKASNAILFSSYHISDKTITAYINALDKFNPTIIDSYPSAIYEIAKFILENKYKHNIKPAAIITSSETLFDYQRDSIERAFNCKIFDHLGSAEMVTFITQCKNGNYHINPEYGYVEVLDNNYNPVNQGEPGQLVCTSFINKAMPIMRYSLGDTITISNHTCECGLYFPVVSSILGRTDDIIIGCDGRKVGRLDPIFKGMDHSINETQIIQYKLNEITVKITSHQSAKSINTDKIITELKKRVGDCMKITIEFVDYIPKTNSGKFRTVVSHINKS